MIFNIQSGEIHYNITAPTDITRPTDITGPTNITTSCYMTQSTKLANLKARI